MAGHLDVITGRPIGEWRLLPPEIYTAKNGYVLRTYDIVTDQPVYQVAINIEDVRVALHAWADEISADIRRGVEKKLETVGS